MHYPRKFLEEIMFPNKFYDGSFGGYINLCNIYSEIVFLEKRKNQSAIKRLFPFFFTMETFSLDISVINCYSISRSYFWRSASNALYGFTPQLENNGHNHQRKSE